MERITKETPYYLNDHPFCSLLMPEQFAPTKRMLRIQKDVAGTSWATPADYISLGILADFVWAFSLSITYDIQSLFKITKLLLYTKCIFCDKIPIGNYFRLSNLMLNPNYDLGR